MPSGRYIRGTSIDDGSNACCDEDARCVQFADIQENYAIEQDCFRTNHRRSISEFAVQRREQVRPGIYFVSFRLGWSNTDRGWYLSVVSNNWSICTIWDGISAVFYTIAK